MTRGKALSVYADEVRGALQLAGASKLLAVVVITIADDGSGKGIDIDCGRVMHPALLDPDFVVARTLSRVSRDYRQQRAKAKADAKAKAVQP